MNKLILGIDIGGVIIDRPDKYNNIQDKMMPWAFETIARLIQVFEGRVWIVSKASCAGQLANREWLNINNFYALTGVKEEHLRFCLERCEKAPICQELNITHFVDDTEEVLNYMIGIVPHRFLFNRNWSETELAIMRTI